MCDPHDPGSPVSELIPVERMSHRERAHTPRAFARLLIRICSEVTGTQSVAVLWVARRSVYRLLVPPAMLWDRERDALTYPGPWPVIAHPPCGPWGKFKWRSMESREHGIAAMRYVHTYGGVVEQPVGSFLFREFGGRGRVIAANQADFGHRALKPTLLYVAKGQ